MRNVEGSQPGCCHVRKIKQLLMHTQLGGVMCLCIHSAIVWILHFPTRPMYWKLGPHPVVQVENDRKLYMWERGGGICMLSYGCVHTVEARGQYQVSFFYIVLHLDFWDRFSPNTDLTNWPWDLSVSIHRDRLQTSAILLEFWVGTEDPYSSSHICTTNTWLSKPSSSPQSGTWWNLQLWLVRCLGECIWSGCWMLELGPPLLSCFSGPSLPFNLYIYIYCATIGSKSKQSKQW